MSGLRFWAGLDLGQASDPTALAVIQRVEEDLHLRYLSRPPLRTGYEKIASGVVRRLCELEPVGAFGERHPVGLAVDGTGCGRPVVDLLLREVRALGRYGPKIQLLPVVVTGGTSVTTSGGYVHVPKRDLIASALVALEQGKLKIGADVPERETLVNELLGYRSKINVATGHAGFEPWREGAHDDLLFATALATWAWHKTLKQRPARKWNADYCSKGRASKGSISSGFYR